LIDTVQPEVKLTTVEVKLEADGSWGGGLEGLRLDESVVGDGIGEIPSLLNDTN